MSLWVLMCVSQANNITGKHSDLWNPWICLWTGYVRGFSKVALLYLDFQVFTLLRPHSFHKIYTNRFSRIEHVRQHFLLTVDALYNTWPLDIEYPVTCRGIFFTISHKANLKGNDEMKWLAMDSRCWNIISLRV